MITLIRNNGGRSTIHPEPRPREMTTTTSSNGCGPTLANVDYSLAGSVSPSQSTSPEGSPYSYTQSNITSPRTPSLGSPCSVSNPSMNSVGSFQHSSPESTPHGSPALVFQPSPNYSVRNLTILSIEHSRARYWQLTFSLQSDLIAGSSGEPRGIQCWSDDVRRSHRKPDSQPIP